jgi:alpha-aminoadipate/glutamate carrier protein LysW
MATCPECDADLEVDPDDLDEMEVGDPWDCDACGSHLRVAALSPLEFDSDDEDDEDEDEDEEDGDEEGDDADDEDDDEDGDADDGEWEE